MKSCEFAIAVLIFKIVTGKSSRNNSVENRQAVQLGTFAEGPTNTYEQYPSGSRKG